MSVCHSFFGVITSVTELPAFIIPFPLAATGDGRVRVDAAPRHRLLREFHPVPSAPRRAKGPKDPSSSLKVELQPPAVAGASCLLPLAVFSEHLAPGQVWQVRVMEEDFTIYHSSIPTPLPLQEGLRIKQNEEGKKSKNAVFLP